jgi:hypothetical protein
VSEHRLAGAVEKVNRAKEQFDELRAEMDAFFNAEPKPHTSIGEFDTDSWAWIEGFQIRQPPPLRFGVILGDCVHNLRSSLDHVIWQVTLLDGGTPDDSTQFPVASKSEAQFEAMANLRIPGLSKEHRALVKRVQPYHRGDAADAHPLAVLADLSNTDKHQILNPTYSFLANDTSDTLDRLIDSSRAAATGRRSCVCASCTRRSLENAVAPLEGRPDHPVMRAFRRALFDHHNWARFESAARQAQEQANPSLPALVRWLDYYAEPVAAQLQTRSSLGPNSIGAVEASLRQVDRAFQGRSQGFGNRRRLNLLLDLMTLHANGHADPRLWADRPRERLHPRAGIAPGQRPHDDPRGYPSLLA